MSTKGASRKPAKQPSALRHFLGLNRGGNPPQKTATSKLSVPVLSESPDHDAINGSRPSIAKSAATRGRSAQQLSSSSRTASLASTRAPSVPATPRTSSIHDAYAELPGISLYDCYAELPADGPNIRRRSTSAGASAPSNAETAVSDGRRRAASARPPSSVMVPAARRSSPPRPTQSTIAFERPDTVAAQLGLPGAVHFVDPSHLQAPKLRRPSPHSEEHRYELEGEIPLGPGASDRRPPGWAPVRPVPARRSGAKAAITGTLRRSASRAFAHLSRPASIANMRR